MSALPISSQTVSQSTQQQQQSNATQETTYLSRCVEKLDLKKTAALERKATWIKIAAVATLVVFTVIAIGAFVGTGLFAPVFLPIAGITAICILPGVGNIYKQIMNKSMQFKEQANDNKRLQELHAPLVNATTAQIQEQLLQKGINWQQIPGMLENPERLKTLTPLIARQNQWESRIAELTQERAKTQREISNIVAESPTETDQTREKLLPLRNHLLEIDQVVLKAKINAAFINAVMRRPEFRGNDQTLFSFTQIEPFDRIIRQACGHDAERINQLVHFKREGVLPITLDEAGQDNNIHILGQRILAAMPNPTV